MRKNGWRIAGLTVLVLMMSAALGGWPATVSGQDDSTPPPEDTSGAPVVVDTPAGGAEVTAEVPTVAPVSTLDTTGEAQFGQPEGAPVATNEAPFVQPGNAPVATSQGLFATLEPGATVGDVGLWAEPFNLSRSGAASQPAIASEPDGTLHALWWDEFDGTKVAYYTPNVGWSEAKTVSVILGGRTVVQGRAQRTPPSGLRVFASSSGWVHAFWIDSKNNLRYARSRSQSGVFALGPTLAINPLAWDVTIDSADELHVVYLRADNTATQPAGVYYRSSPSDGAAWRSPVLLKESLYFRSISADRAFLQVTSDGNGTVVVSWDDAEIRRSYYAVSRDGGQKFDEPVAVENPDQDFARHTRFFPLADAPGAFLRLWQAGDACALYQQSANIRPDLVTADLGTATATATASPTPSPEPTLSTTELAPTPLPIISPAEAMWDDPIRVLDSLGNCLNGTVSYPLVDGRLLAVMNVAGGQSLLTTWDGSRWVDPVNLQISFVEPILNQPVTLTCLNLAVAGEQLAAVGCDARGDVWATVSRFPLTELLPVLTTAWDAPHVISSSDGDAGLPAVAADAGGQLFGVWSQSQKSGDPATDLVDVSSDGVSWPAANAVISAREGQADMPSLTVGPGNYLHVLWSGGYTGEIMYSRAFIRDARVSSGWSQPSSLPAPRPVGGWPDLAIDADGVLHAVYTIPLNEDRGVYYTRSEDQGTTWSDYRRVFDAAAAQWAMVRNTRLAVDMEGRLHLLWVKAALPGAGSSLGVYYARSDDGGQTWTEPVQVSGVDSDNPQLVIAGPNEIHVAWIETSAAGLGIWHSWSPDGGATWSTALPLPGAPRISGANFGLASDGNGNVYLTAIERSRQNAAALLYTRWDGQSWVDRESVALGYDPAPDSGAVPVLLPQSALGVFYRVRALQQGASAHYIVGYISRPLPSDQIAMAATFTPLPELTSGPEVGVAATRTPQPTPDISSVAAPTVDNSVRIQIVIAGVAILLIAGLAVFQLGRRR